MRNENSDEWLKAVGKESYKSIDQSGGFISLYTKNFVDDPLCALQLGYAIMMDKPIYLLVEKGQIVPEALRRAAASVDIFESKDHPSFKEAVNNIAERVKE